MSRIRRAARSAARSGRWKIGVYIRLSREDKKAEENRGQSRGGGNAGVGASGSVVEQDKILTEWVTDYFRNEDYEIVDYFVDDGLTGTDDARDNFQRLLEYAKDGRVNCIVAKTLSRAFRNYADQGKYLEEVFPRLAVRFIATGDPFVDSYNDPDAISSGMEIPINGLMNDRFAAKTSADVRRTLDAKRKRGEFIGAFAPYGYVKDPENKNRLLIDEEAAAHVRDIFYWFVVGGMSKRGIAHKLNQSGVLNPTAYKQHVQKLKYQNANSHKNDGMWHEKKITEILQNETYLGAMVQGRQRVVSYKVHALVKTPEEDWFVVRDKHEAIVDRELFEKARRLHARDTRTAPGAGEPHLFAGLLRCPDCGKAMRRKTSKGHVYFHCRTANDKGKDACVSRSIKEEKLTEAVIDAIRAQVMIAKLLDEAVDAVNRSPTVKTRSARLSNNLKLRQAELDKVTAASDALYMDWKNGEMTEDEYRRRKTSFSEKANVLKMTIQNIQGEIETLAIDVNEDAPYLAAFLQHGNITGLNRGILSDLIDAICVHKGGQVTIDFAFGDEMKRTIDLIENNTTM